MDRHKIGAALCKTCRMTPWMQLPSESEDAHPHKSSYRELAQSAKTCALCALILQAGVAEADAESGYRYGKGMWILTGSEKRPTREQYGACLPVSSARLSALWTATDTYNSRTTECVVRDIRKERLVYGPQRPPDASLRVYLYNNTWTGLDPNYSHLDSSGLLLGFGVRFSHDPKPRYVRVEDDLRAPRQVGDIVPLREDDDRESDKTVMDLRGSFLRMGIPYGGKFEPFIGTRILTPHPKTAEVIAWLKRRTKQCDNHHNCIPRRRHAPPLPMRVLDLVTQSQAVVLTDGSGRTGEYIALSHARGSLAFSTTKTNLIEMQASGVLVSNLPKTYRDAIAVANAFRIRYLWIDLMCAIQDDLEDCVRASAKISDIYSNAYLSISATASSNANGGCFIDRESSKYFSLEHRSMGYNTIRDTAKAVHVMGYLAMKNGGDILSDELYLWKEWMPPSYDSMTNDYVVGRFGSLADPIRFEHLSSKLWSLQERLLSPRMIHFGAQQLFWECPQLMLAEDGTVLTGNYADIEELIAREIIPDTERTPCGVYFPRPKDGSTLRAGKRTLPSLRGSWFRGWIDVVEEYSRRFTCDSDDRLSALSGLARRIAERTGNTYWAGLWKEHIWEDLLWRRCPVLESTGSARVPTYRTPSWSWASGRTSVDFLPVNGQTIVSSLIDCKVALSTQDAFGQVGDAMLTVRGPLHKLEASPHTSPLRSNGVDVRIDTDKQKVIDGVAWFDDVTDTIRVRPCYALFIDTASAIIVASRTTKTESQSHPQAKELEPDLILTSNESCDRKPPSQKIKDNASVYRPSKTFERVGIAVFKPMGQMPRNFDQTGKVTVIIS